MRDKGPTLFLNHCTAADSLQFELPMDQFLSFYTDADADVQLSPFFFPPSFLDHSTGQPHMQVSYLHSCPTSIREMHPGLINPFTICYDLQLGTLAAFPTTIQSFERHVTSEVLLQPQKPGFFPVGFLKVRFQYSFQDLSHSHIF